ncbi:MAG: glycerol-3-phosphate 1-O-acyltransferase PlsY [Wenzhouxiangella sp.]|jgi:glycerol-3-phosphate acyltransferase PlsY|nr:glycerol-3-phosphate 1-O-acyltransferase PlsY [Wenzhouxiangella sp.]
MTALALAAASLLGYLLGSVSGSLLLGRFRNLDIRSMGSGNAGGTNALRTVGWRFALAVVLVDLGKGAVAALLGLWLLRSVFSLPDAALAGASLAGYFAVVGHVWPVYFGFRGGKGAGTAVGTIAVLAPWCILPLFLVWIITILGTGYVGLATILAGLSLVPAVWVLGPSPLPPVLGMLAIAVAITLIFTHRSNLVRLRDGSENRFERARLLKRKQ